MNQEQSLLMAEGTNSSPDQSPELEEHIKADENKAMNQLESREEDGIKFLGWGFKIDRLFEVAYRFYKRNESKAFHPSFDIRNQMNALILQARYGNFDDGKAPDIGTLDLVGKSRRHQWSLLKGMSKTEAMSKFICTLDEICPLFKAYAEAIKISSGIQLETEDKESNRERSDSERQNQSDSDEQLKAIHTSLCRQTYNQFKNYAEKQYPNDLSKQKYLITSLQEQYYQQYISKMKPELSSQKTKRSSLPSPTTSEASTTDSNQVNNNSTPDASEVQSNITSPTFNSPDTTDEKNALILTSSQSNDNKSIGEQSIDLAPVVKSDSKDLDPKNSNNSYATTTQQTSPPPANSTPKTHLQSPHRDDVMIECSSVEPLTKLSNISETSRHEDSNEENPIIGEFESYPEPKPIQRSTESQQRSSVISLFNYRADGGLKHQQNQQPTTTSLYGNSTSHNFDDTLPPSLPSCPAPPPPQQFVVPSQEEQLTSNPRTSPEVELRTNHNNQLTETPIVDTWGCDGSSGSSSPLQQTATIYEPLEPATIWTKKGVNEYKDSLMNDKHGGTYIVKQGTLLTIQVPTYPDGRYIYWEFATEDYDIGFGLDFVYETNLEKPLALKLYEETDEDDDNSDETALDNVHFDLERQNGSDPTHALIRSRAEKFARIANTISIIPTYRRDSHEEVFVGRHRYPGQGYYLLKFDNTYSVLRSKPLFFRICYFI